MGQQHRMLLPHAFFVVLPVFFYFIISLIQVGIVECKTCAFDPEISKSLLDSGWSGGVKLEERNFLGRNIGLSLEVCCARSSSFIWWMDGWSAAVHVFLWQRKILFPHLNFNPPH